MNQWLELSIGSGGNDVWGAVVWGVVIILVFGALSVWRYQRAVTR